MTELQLRAALCGAGRLLWQRNLIGPVEGNLSARLGPGQLLCTPRKLNKGLLRPDDLVLIDLEGRVIQGGAPSSEIRLHLECYAQRPDCQAVLHAHPPVATAMALAGVTIPDNLLPEAAMVLGSVALVPFALPGTESTREVIRPLLADHKVFLLSNHGALTLGATIEDAYARMETLERVATVVRLAQEFGGPQPMPRDAFQTLLETSLNARLD